MTVSQTVAYTKAIVAPLKSFGSKTVLLLGRKTMPKMK